MLRSVRRGAWSQGRGGSAAGAQGHGGGGGSAGRSRGGAWSRTGAWPLRLLGSVAGGDRGGGSPKCALAAVVLVFLGVTAVFFAAIERHDVDLSFDQRRTLGRDTRTFANRTVYLAEPSRVDPVLSQLSHDEWRKVSTKIDYVAFVYDRVDITAVLEKLSVALERLTPHGYGIVLFSCGCLIHNVLLQHVSVRFDGMECAMLPGFVFETEAVQWVHTSLAASSCKSRDRLLGEPWYDVHAYKLQDARDEYIAVRRHLRLEQHPDRDPGAPAEPVAVHIRRPGG